MNENPRSFNTSMTLKAQCLAPSITTHSKSHRWDIWLILRFSLTITEPLHSVCMLVALNYSQIICCLEEQAGVANEVATELILQGNAVGRTENKLDHLMCTSSCCVGLLQNIYFPLDSYNDPLSDQIFWIGLAWLNPILANQNIGKSLSF